MEIGSNILEDLWPETFKTAGYLLNRMPSKTLDWKSPFQTLQKALLQEEE
jgi:IS30 family transposase